MDRPIEKKSFMRRYVWYMAAAVAVVALLVWLVFTTSANTQTIDRNDVTISPVTRGKFDDYVRLNGQVVPIRVVQISLEEGGIVREKVMEEGTRVKKGDVILRLSNSNLDLQILNAEAELAEKQNLLRNTQVSRTASTIAPNRLRSTWTASVSCEPISRIRASSRRNSSVRRCICKAVRTTTSRCASNGSSASA